jgi:protein TonB
VARSGFVAFSLVVHGALAVSLGYVEVRASRAATAIEIAETVAKKKEPPPPAKVEPEPPKPEKAARRTPRAAPVAAPEPLPAAPSEPVPAAGPEGFSDFGLSLSGGIGGVPIAQRAAMPSEKPERVAVKQLARRALDNDPCSEPASKPKPRSVPQPKYPDAARSAGIEGKVRVELTVDESGRVVNVRVVQGLGYGLDEAAVTAARQASFEPALRCGKPTSATFTIAMRFTAS